MSSKFIYLLSKLEIDIFFINILYILLISIVLSTQPSSFSFLNILRFLLAFVGVSFFPGYLFLKIYFSEREINSIERVALSFGLSMVLIPIIGLILAYSPLGITIYSILISIYSFVLILSIFGQLQSKYSLRIFDFKFNLKSINMFLTFILITLLGILVRVYPASKYSNFIGYWVPGNQLYPIYYTVQTGQLLENITSAPTSFAATISGTFKSRASIIFNSFLFLLTGFKDLDKFLLLNKFFPWYGTLLLPLSATLVAVKITKSMRKEIPAHYILLIYFVVTFFSNRLIMESRYMACYLVIGYSMWLFTIYFLFSEKNIKNQLLAIVFSIFIFLYYYTSGLIFLITLTTIIILQTIRRNEIIPNSFAVIYGICFLAYYMYLAVNIFRSYIIALEKAIFIPVEPPGQDIFGRSVVGIEYLPIYLNFILINIIITTFILLWLKKKIRYNYLTNFVVYAYAGLIIAGLLLSMWLGPKGIARLMAYTVTLVPIVLSFLLYYSSNSSKRLKIITIIISILIILSSVTAYISEIVPLEYVTHQEELSVLWLCKHKEYKNNKDFIFTDARIGTISIMLSRFDFVGPTGDTKAAPQEVIVFKNIFYGTDDNSAARTLLSYKATYILLSEEMEKLGIGSLTLNYKPLSKESLIKYRRSVFFGEIYNNEESYIYQLSRY